MACDPCQDCYRSGVVLAHADGSVLTCCRNCGGWGMQRVADNDDEGQDLTLRWTEFIRWKDCA
jgi:predicted  nucleic acid-binding Zn-ribbon protein